ncbi:MAG: response regulator [Proteobacteria bacterium]|jgi:DNA-binding response OmpR family regulator|nr:response regulator [Pseudomonadota bacterium]
MRILLVEDDALLGDALQVGLRGQGFAVEWIRDGAAGEAALASDQFTAVVLDLGLPRMTGLELLQRVRDRGDRTPVVILTARDAVDDRVRGLDLGADDYVVKPVALTELGARLRAVARRAQGTASGAIVVGRLTVDLASRTVKLDGNPVELQAREFALLQELVLRAGRVVTRTQLETQLYEWDRSIDSNAIEVHVHHLRRKLAPELIRTVRGVGYMVPREA